MKNTKANVQKNKRQKEEPKAKTVQGRRKVAHPKVAVQWGKKMRKKVGQEMGEAKTTKKTKGLGGSVAVVEVG